MSDFIECQGCNYMVEPEKCRYTMAEKGRYCSDCWESVIDPDSAQLLEERIAKLEAALEGRGKRIAELEHELELGGAKERLGVVEAQRKRIAQLGDKLRIAVRVYPARPPEDWYRQVRDELLEKGKKMTDEEYEPLDKHLRKAQQLIAEPERTETREAQKCRSMPHGV